ncbi:hypothetical protein LIER_34224 [Lithospermum erythrorhizon]|uniref:CCHC-type domain-containing protein n=1 Tax=Lithospermum erythrorhizon TaxID=34254 RepID=A0AAV3RYW5_LITER
MTIALEARDKFGFINDLSKSFIYARTSKQLWEEIAERFGSVKPNYVDDDEEKMMQFLMGLNEEYEAIRNQVLLKEPLPRNTYNFGNKSGVRFGRMERANLKCGFCGKQGHVKSGCFRLIGWPNQNQNQNYSRGKYRANNAFVQDFQEIDTHLDGNNANSGNTSNGNNEDFQNLIACMV